MPPGFSPEAFGKYYLVDKIATGGMAEIFKAKSFSHAGFEKLLVIKRILQHHSENEDFVKMFIDEAKISVQLQHPNIVHIYDFGKLHSNCYIAMECVNGKDVKQLLRKLAVRRKYLPEEYAVYIAHETLSGLDYAHNKTNLHGEPLKIVHRDMSPSNVLVGYEGDVKVADFGIAKAEHRAYDTKDGILKGKFEYMSPEQTRGKAVTGLSDVFSSGIILWEMLTGRRMFKTDSDLATLEKIKAGGYPPPSVLNPHISARLDALVMKALSLDEADRYPNAVAFQNALASYLAPNTPSVIKRSLADFLHELFEEEREEEKNALDAGSQVAQELFNRPEDLSLEPEWQEDLNTAGPTLHQAPSRSKSLVTPLLVLLIGLAGTAVALQLGGGEETAPVPQPTPQIVSNHASVSFTVAPVDAIVYADGKMLGAGPLIEVEELQTGTVQIRVEATGFEPKEFPMTLRPNTEHERTIELNEIPEPAEPAESAAASPGPVTPVETAPVEAVEETPPTPAPAPVVRYGKVSVTVSGGWGNLEIDGQSRGTTPFTGTLPTGTHRIRVYREDLGYDLAQTVTIKRDTTLPVSFSP